MDNFGPLGGQYSVEGGRQSARTQPAQENGQPPAPPAASPIDAHAILNGRVAVAFLGAEHRHLMPDRRLPPGMEASVLAEGNHLFRHPAEFLGLCVRGRDLLMLEKGSDHVSEHGFLVAGGPSEFPSCFLMTHGDNLSPRYKISFFL
mgnify:CR=1 FL=1